jgi:hypothetical protein
LLGPRLGHLVAVEYPPGAVADGFARATPFVGPEGMTFGFMAAALALAAVVVPIGWVRAALAVVGGFATLYVLPAELSGTALVAGWAALAVVAIGLFVWVVAPRIAPDFVEKRTSALALPASIEPAVAAVVGSVSELIRPAVALVGVVAGIGAIGHLVAIEYAPADTIAGAASSIPFGGLNGLAFAIVLAMLAGAGLLVPIVALRVGLTALGGLIAIYVFPFELSARPSSGLVGLATASSCSVLPSPASGRALRAISRWARPPAVWAVGLLAGRRRRAPREPRLPARPPRRSDLSSYPYIGQGISLAGALAALAAVGWLFGARWFRLGAAGSARPPRLHGVVRDRAAVGRGRLGNRGSRGSRRRPTARARRGHPPRRNHRRIGRRAAALCSA